MGFEKLKKKKQQKTEKCLFNIVQGYLFTRILTIFQL